MSNHLLLLLVIALIFIVIEFIYKKIILRFIIVKYKQEHDKLIYKLSQEKHKYCDDRERKAIELLEKLLESHSERLVKDNIRAFLRFKNKLKKDSEFRHKYQSEITKNKAILDNAPTEFRHIFNQSFEIVKTTFVLNSILDILLVLFPLTILLLPYIIIMGLLGKSFSKFKSYVTKNDWVLTSQ